MRKFLKIFAPLTKGMMNKVFLLTGRNLGNPGATLAQAQKIIGERCGTVVQASAVYRTAAWGKTDQPDFLNQVLLVHTPLQAHGLLQCLQQIEVEAGRQRLEKYGPRLLDVDILLFNDEVIDTPNLKIPHPQMEFRRFVLVPLAELAPDKVHPLKKLTVSQLLAQCPDNLYVHKL